jgi:hypothetical protein
MLWHQLFECNKKPRLNGNTAGNGSSTVTSVSLSARRGYLHGSLSVRGSVKEQIQNKACNVWNHADDDDKLCKLRASPCSFQISASKEHGQSGHHQSNDVLLHECSRHKGPRVFVRPAGNQRQQWRAMANSCKEPESGIGKKKVVQEGQSNEDDEKRPSAGRQIDSHGQLDWNDNKHKI